MKPKDSCLAEQGMREWRAREGWVGSEKEGKGSRPACWRCLKLCQSTRCREEVRQEALNRGSEERKMTMTECCISGKAAAQLRTIVL